MVFHRKYKKYRSIIGKIFTSGGLITMVLYIKINDEFAYYATYVSPVPQYVHYLPSAQNVLESLKIHKPEFDALMSCLLLKASPSIINSVAGLGIPGSGFFSLAGNVSVALSC
jgi:hypothetical protein